MIALVVLVLSVALVDSLNPSTIVPALYLATGARPVRAVLGFAAGFFAVNMAGGVVVLLLGHRLARYVPHPSHGVLHAGEVALGLGAIAGSAVLWRRRDRVDAAFARAEARVTRAAPLAGATIAAFELPTALPYFAVIAALAASSQRLATDIVLLLVFNLVYLAPVIAIAVVRALAGERAVGLLTQARELVLRRAGAVLAGLVLAVGLALLVIGTIGLAKL